MPPLRSTRNVVIAVKSRAGRAPPLPRGDFYVLQSPQNFPSSVTCGDSFPQGGSHTGGSPANLGVYRKITLWQKIYAKKEVNTDCIDSPDESQRCNAKHPNP